jgi:serine protease Do
MMNPAFRRFLALCLVFLTCFLGVSLLRNLGSGKSPREWFASLFQRKQQFQPEKYSLPDHAALQLGDVELLSRLNDEYAKLTQAVIPAVVSIDTAGIRTERMLDIWGRASVRQYPTQGQGSGAIVTHEGHIVTNHHVIAGQQEIRVTLHDGRSLSAKLIGEDPLLDIAVLKIISDEKFTPLKLGDSSHVQVGQMVFAIGNPFGLGETVTQGIISAKERSLSDNQRDLFQTDAAINPGNSGGPLVNLRGEIIGINVAIFSPDRENPGFQGVGFSIPANDVRDSLTQILERGRPIRGFLGVQMHDLNATILQQLGLPTDQSGALVLGVSPGSPAETFGIRQFDIITSFAGKPIRTATQLFSMVQSSRPGEEIELALLRAGKQLTLKATLSESGESSTGVPGNPSDPAKPAPPAAADPTLRAIGIELRDTSPEEQMRGIRGTVVTAIAPNTLASLHLLPGDLIIGINNQRINSTLDFTKLLAASSKQQNTTLFIHRNGRNIRLTLPSLSQVD